MSADLRGVSIDRIVLRGVDLGPGELLALRVALRRALRLDPTAIPGPPTATGSVRGDPVALAKAVAARILEDTEALR